jgi:hypothetical protein
MAQEAKLLHGLKNLISSLVTIWHDMMDEKRVWCAGSQD